MHIVRFREAATDVSGGWSTAVGVRVAGRTIPVPEVQTLADLWALPRDELQALLAGAARASQASRASDQAGGPVDLVAPIDGRTEVWAAGVTYEVSREARVSESRQAASVYEMVYGAERPELFFKSASWRVAGPGDPIAIRPDSTWDVPEPELALVINRFGEIVGVTACNDVSSRSIEGENPLYLPQAKVYLGSCALGPVIRPIWEVESPYALAIGLAIRRGGAVAWDGGRAPLGCTGGSTSWSSTCSGLTGSPMVRCSRPGHASCPRPRSPCPSGTS